jgi:hypothetical protein
VKGAIVTQRGCGSHRERHLQTAELTATHEAAGFGSSVAVNGPTVVVGARDPAGTGAAYVFVRPASGWAGSLTQSATLKASDGASGDEFGNSVAVYRHTIVVGAPGHDAEHGMAYAFVLPASGWAGDPD